MEKTITVQFKFDADELKEILKEYIVKSHPGYEKTDYTLLQIPEEGPVILTLRNIN